MARKIRTDERPRELDFGSSQSDKQHGTEKIFVSLEMLYMQRNRYIIDPAFQREEVWPVRMQQALIDTILLGRSIPPLTGYVVDDEITGQRSYVITDGHQRIVACLDYMAGIFRTWTPGQKRRSEPSSKPPVEPGRTIDKLSVTARNNLKQYNLEINLEAFESDAEVTIHFLRMNNQVPLSAAERLNAYKSKAKDAANRIERHPFWEDFYAGEFKRKQLFQSSLQLLALELSAPRGIIDLQSGVYFQGLAAGNRDKDITDALVENILRRLTIVGELFDGVRFTKRATIVPMYQSIMFLEQAKYTFQPKNRGDLAEWMKGLIAESNRPSGIPMYVQPLQRLLRESAQKAFWERNWERVKALLKVNDAA